QCVYKWPASPFMATRDAIVFKNEIRQPLRNSKTFVFAVRYRFQAARTDVLPIVIGNPTALCSKNALQDDTAMAGIDHLVESNVPTGRGVERIEHALHSVRRLLVQ